METEENVTIEEEDQVLWATCTCSCYHQDTSVIITLHLSWSFTFPTPSQLRQISCKVYTERLKKNILQKALLLGAVEAIFSHFCKIFDGLIKTKIVTCFKDEDVESMQRNLYLGWECHLYWKKD